MIRELDMYEMRRVSISKEVYKDNYWHIWKVYNGYIVSNEDGDRLFTKNKVEAFNYVSKRQFKD